MISINGEPHSELPWVSVAEVARVTGRTVRQVRNWITDGKLHARRDERGAWSVHPDDVKIPAATRRSSQRKSAGATGVVPQVPAGNAVDRRERDDPGLMMGLEVAMLRAELAQSRAELAAAHAALTGKDTLLTERTAQLVAARNALRALADVGADPVRSER
jgi:hypothetical protein